MMEYMPIIDIEDGIRNLKHIKKEVVANYMGKNTFKHYIID